MQMSNGPECGRFWQSTCRLQTICSFLIASSFRRVLSSAVFWVNRHKTRQRIVWKSNQMNLCRQFWSFFLHLYEYYCVLLCLPLWRVLLPSPRSLRFSPPPLSRFTLGYNFFSRPSVWSSHRGTLPCVDCWGRGVGWGQMFLSCVILKPLAPCLGIYHLFLACLWQPPAESTQPVTPDGPGMLLTFTSACLWNSTASKLAF